MNIDGLEIGGNNITLGGETISSKVELISFYCGFPNNSSEGASMPDEHIKRCLNKQSDPFKVKWAWLDSDYDINIDPGVYKIEWSAPGYSTQRFMTYIDVYNNKESLRYAGNILNLKTEESGISSGSTLIELVEKSKISLYSYTEHMHSQGLGIALDSGIDQVFGKIIITKLN